MQRLKRVYALTMIVLWCGLAIAQSRFPTPPPAADPDANRPAPQNSTRTLRIDALRIERDARELADLSQTIPMDTQHIDKGLLPKDTIQKLKHIEKLAKRLRGELMP
jgi:hypothetical protein